jgi:hypothetical protein
MGIAIPLFYSICVSSSDCNVVTFVSSIAIKQITLYSNISIISGTGAAIYAGVAVEQYNSRR